MTRENPEAACPKCGNNGGPSNEVTDTVYNKGLDQWARRCMGCGHIGPLATEVQGREYKNSRAAWNRAAAGNE